MAPVNVNDSTVFRDGAGVCVAEGGGGEEVSNIECGH